MPAAVLAVEQSFPLTQRVVDDPFAIRMLPLGGQLFVRFLRLPWMRDWMIGRAEKNDPGIWGGMLCRKRYIDEVLAAARNQIEAVVNLGAGFDTRAFRLPALSGLPVWEIDQAGNIEEKTKRLREALGTIPPNIRLIPLDFDRDELGSTLAAHGYSTAKPGFLIWEAVMQYLTEPGVRATFDWLARAAPGSRLAFTYVRRNFLSGKSLYGWEGGYRRFVASKIWLFGMQPEDWPGFLNEYGWRIIEDVGYDELAARYLAPAGRRLTGTPVERIVYAEKI